MRARVENSGMKNAIGKTVRRVQRPTPVARQSATWKEPHTEGQRVKLRRLRTVYSYLLTVGNEMAGVKCLMNFTLGEL
jgi:hypothetical protein